MLGPLAGAAVLAVADWRAIFWLNLLLGLGLAAAVVGSARAGVPTSSASHSRPWRPSLGLQLAAPAALAEDVTPACSTSRWSPARGHDPAGRGGGAGGRRARGAQPDPAGGGVLPFGGSAGCRRRSTCWARPWRSWRRQPGGPSRQPIRRPSSWRTARGCCPSHWSPGWPSSCTSAGRPIRCCPARAPSGRGVGRAAGQPAGGCGTGGCAGRRPPVRPPTTPGDQLGAAFVLLRLLVAVPVGAVAGGWLCRWVAPRIVAVGGMALAAMAFVAMTSWDAGSLDGVAVDGGAPGRRPRVRARDRAGQRRAAGRDRHGRARQRQRSPSSPGPSGCSSGCPC